MKRLLLVLLLLLPGMNCQQSTAFAAPPNPLIYDTGPLPPELQTLVTKPRLTVPSMPAESVTQYAISTGTAKVVTILIEFTNVSHASSHNKQYFDNLLFSAGLGYNSMDDFYIENSANKLNLTGTTGGNWYKSDFTMAWYGADGTDIDNLHGPIANLVIEAVKKADNDIDFSQYDTDHDGIVDHLIIVHAGYGQEDSGNTDNIWSHSGDFTTFTGGVKDLKGYLTNDGVHVKNYTMLSEYSPMGIFAHEFGHDLGLPDLYNTQFYGGKAVVGNWDLMDGGSWLGPNRDGTVPAHIGAWGKQRLAWLRPGELVSRETNLQVSTSGSASVLKIPITNADDPVKEYFLVENRQKQGFDRYLPGAGLLIWHIDDAILDYQTTDSFGRSGTALALNVINSEPYVPHRAVRLVEADNNNILNQGSDPFPGTRNVSSFTSPANNAYNGKNSTFSLLNMGSGAGDLMMLDFYQAVFNKGLSVERSYNAPNPAPGGSTKIKIILTEVVDSSEISLQIFSLNGELIREAPSTDINMVALEDNKVVYEFSWDGKNDNGQKVASGVYLYLLKVRSLQKVGKIAVIK